MTKKREGQGAQQIGEIMGDLVAQAQAKAALPPPKRQTKKITPAGLKLLEQLDEPVVEMHRKLLGHMAPEQLRSLIELLAVAREAVAD